jgi:hypothetical protein
MDAANASIDPNATTIRRMTFPSRDTVTHSRARPDPAHQHPRRMMDCRVEPGNDENAKQISRMRRLPDGGHSLYSVSSPIHRVSTTLPALVSAE